jgi:hypothetical protein
MAIERFSERMGFVPVKSALQGRSLDTPSRSRIWSAFVNFIPLHYDLARVPLRMTWMGKLYSDIWSEHLKEPVDELPYDQAQIRERLKTIVLLGKWYEVYDLIEFVVTSKDFSTRAGFATEVNRVLTEELAGFRFINGHFVEITDQTEIAAIETGLAATKGDRFSPARQHLNSALVLLSDRKAPDYRNSIKESISAVEAMTQIISGDPKAELSKALRIIDARTPLHGALRSALNSLYGYTSDANGIRHALTEAENLDSADAKFMLVACSAFVVYLIQKAT